MLFLELGDLLLLDERVGVELAEDWRVDVEFDEGGLDFAVYFKEEVLHIVEESFGLFTVFEVDKDVASVAISMDKVVLHKHLKEGSSPNSCDHLIQRTRMFNIISHRESINKSLNQHRLFRPALHHLREIHSRVKSKILAKSIHILSLNPEIYLLSQCPLHRIRPHRNLESTRYFREHFAYEKQDLHIHFDKSIHPRVPYLYSYFLFIVDCFVDLAH